jgi:hypothetical protein
VKTAKSKVTSKSELSTVKFTNSEEVTNLDV